MTGRRNDAKPLPIVCRKRHLPSLPQQTTQNPLGETDKGETSRHYLEVKGAPYEEDVVRNAPNNAARNIQGKKLQRPPKRRCDTSSYHDSSSDSDIPLMTRQAPKRLKRVAALTPKPRLTYRIKEQRLTPASTVSPIPHTRNSSLKPTHLQDPILTYGNSTSDSEVVVKVEPLSDPALNKTNILAYASHENRAPNLVPLKHCQTLDLLFSTLIRELDIDLNLVDSIKQISVTYCWSGKRLGIRRENELEWLHFCNTIRAAWASPVSRQFVDGCEVEMVLEVKI